MKSTIRFSAKVSNGTVTLPKSAKISNAKIEGTVDAFPIQTDIKSGVLKVGKTKDDVVTIEIVRVGDEPEARLPKEFQKALKVNPEALALWKDITPIARRDWIFWIVTCKQEETRTKRALVACSKLNSGMRRVCCFPGVKWLMKNGKR